MIVAYRRLKIRPKKVCAMQKKESREEKGRKITLIGN